MNVVITGTFGFPSGSASAARLRQLALGLEENGASVHLVPMAYTANDEIGLPASEEHRFSRNITYQHPAIFVKRLRLAPSASGKSWDRFRGRLGWFVGLYASIPFALSVIRKRVAAGRCDLILVYGRSAVQMAAILRLAAKHKIPTVLDIVEVHESFTGLGGRMSPLYWDWRVGTRVLPKRFSALSVINHALRDMYRQLGCQRLLVIPSIEGWEELHIPQCSTRPSAFRLVYVGALLPRDAPELLLQSFRILRRRNVNVELEIVGRYGSYAFGRALEQAIRTDPELDRVQMRGELTDPELAVLIESGDGLLLTRRNARTEIYAFPTRLVEYLKTGKPVFVSAVGDIGMYLRDGIDAVLLSSEEPEAIADAIQHVAESHDRGSAIGRSGQQRGAEVFSRKTHAARLLKFMGLQPEARIPEKVTAGQS